MSSIDPEKQVGGDEDDVDFPTALGNMCKSMGMVEYSGGKTYLENYFRQKLAEHYGIDPWDITPELLERWEHELEFDSRPNPDTIPQHLNFLTRREILERRKRVEAILAERAVEG